MIVEEQGLGAPLSLVIAGTRSDRIDPAPIFLGLRVDFGITVDLARRGLQDFRAGALGETEHVDRSVHAGLGRLNRIMLVVDRRGRTGEIVDLVHLHEERECHVVPLELESGMVQQVRDIGTRSGEQIVHAQDLVPFVDQPFAQMRAQESGASGDQNARRGIVNSRHELSSNRPTRIDRIGRPNRQIGPAGRPGPAKGPWTSLAAAAGLTRNHVGDMPVRQSSERGLSARDGD